MNHFASKPHPSLAGQPMQRRDLGHPSDLPEVELLEWLACARTAKSVRLEGYEAEAAMRAQATTLIPRLLDEVNRRRIDAESQHHLRKRLEWAEASAQDAQADAKRLRTRAEEAEREARDLVEHKYALSARLENAEREAVSLRGEVQRLRAEVEWLKNGTPMPGERP